MRYKPHQTETAAIRSHACGKMAFKEKMDNTQIIKYIPIWLNVCTCNTQKVTMSAKIKTLK